MIKNCTCKHEYQDNIHGEGKRVFNPCQGEKRKGYSRCTVCGEVKESK